METLIHSEPEVDTDERKSRQKKSEWLSKSLMHRVLLFTMIVAGSLAHWFWVVGWGHLIDLNHPFDPGPLRTIMVRIALSACMAVLMFPSLCARMEESGDEPWLCYTKAFGTGFFSQAALEAIVGHVS